MSQNKSTFVSKVGRWLDSTLTKAADKAEDQLRAVDSTSKLDSFKDGEVSRTEIVFANEKEQVVRGAKGAYKWGKDNPIKSIIIVVLLFLGLR